MDWWPDADADHVSLAAGAGALGRAVAWRHDAWHLRAALTEALSVPTMLGP